MLIKNLYNLFCDSESQKGRLDSSIPPSEIVEKENTAVIIPRKFKDDCIGDADTNLLRCIDPDVSDPNRMFGRLFIEDLMAAAGYVDGDKYSLKSPVILHRDNNPTNFQSDNLEYVEATDTRYIEYQEKVKEWKHRRNIELNPGKELHPGW